MAAVVAGALVVVGALVDGALVRGATDEGTVAPVAGTDDDGTDVDGVGSASGSGSSLQAAIASTSTPLNTAATDRLPPIEPTLTSVDVRHHPTTDTRHLGNRSDDV